MPDRAQCQRLAGDGRPGDGCENGLTADGRRPAAGRRRRTADRHDRRPVPDTQTAVRGGRRLPSAAPERHVGLLQEFVPGRKRHQVYINTAKVLLYSNLTSERRCILEFRVWW